MKSKDSHGVMVFIGTLTTFLSIFTFIGSIVIANQYSTNSRFNYEIMLSGFTVGFIIIAIGVYALRTLTNQDIQSKQQKEILDQLHLLTKTSQEKPHEENTFHDEPNYSIEEDYKVYFNSNRNDNDNSINNILDNDNLHLPCTYNQDNKCVHPQRRKDKGDNCIPDTCTRYEAVTDAIGPMEPVRQRVGRRGTAKE